MSGVTYTLFCRQSPPPQDILAAGLSVDTTSHRGQQIYYTTNATLVCVLSYMSSAEVCLFFAVGQNLGDRDADLLESFHDGTAISRTMLLAFWWRYL